ncbi:MAG: DUF885 domain-containing protein [Verrucomicrobia bacterium]|nr:DUF885 domain-containing protein [Verrucomicrobiota bacterium]
MRLPPLLLAAVFAPALLPAGPTEDFQAFLKAEWEYRLEQSPTFASSLGDRRWNDKWGDQSLAAVEARQVRQTEAAKRLAAIPRAQLSETDQLNYDLYERDLQEGIASRAFKLYLVAIDQRGGPQSLDEFASGLRFETVKDYEDWVARMQKIPEVLEQATTLLREGVKARIVQPKVVMQRVPAQLDKQIVAKPEDSGFFKPFRRFAAAVPEAERARLTEAAKQAVSERIVPAYKKFKAFFESEYLPGCYDAVGAWQHPAAGFYASRARSFTTTELTPQEIHDIGQAEVKRIRAEMEKIREKVGFKGTLAEFFVHLRTDPKFFYKTGEELLAGYRAISKEIDPLLVKVFRKLPRMPYGVEPIPAAIAPDTTTAYYSQPAADGSRAGRYFVNLYKPETRPKWEMRVLSVHEAVPGHHLQIALAQEQGELPEFRRFGGYTAYVEGWGLYSESLGNEMGLYEDPYDKFGELTYDMWRAVRLVVDTGMHHLKWSRQQAIDFFMANAAKTEQDIVNEIDRYIAWPGQALAYKIGQIKIKELRAKATKALGPKFDLRAWHDHLLACGAVPLSVLEKRMDAWIAAQSK